MIGIITALVVLVIGALEAVAGVYMLAGQGWAMLALGAFTIVGGFIVARGLGN